MRWCLVIAAALLAGCQPRIARTWPDEYPLGYSSLVMQASDQARLVIWGATGRSKVNSLIAEFQRRFPQVRVDYVEMSGSEINRKFLSAVADHRPLPDLVWSSAMDLQIKLVNDGYSQAYQSPESGNVAPWANWKNQAWGTTAEPIVLIYNRKLIADSEMPRGHIALTNFLDVRKSAHPVTIATYDLPRAAVGYLYLSQDQQASHAMWRLLRAMKDNRLQVFTDAEQIMAAVRSGKAAIGYDVIGSYALGEVARDPNLGMILPEDYTLVVSRIAFIPAAAQHPAAARVFLDFLLSQAGQAQLSREHISPVRADVAPPSALVPQRRSFRAIRVGPNLLVDSDTLTREHFLRGWRDALTDHRPPSTAP